MIPKALTFNEDGVSIKGCKTIYAPRGQAGEYAPLATNPYRGCGHKCAYCYVPAAIHMPREEFDAGAQLRQGGTSTKPYLEMLKADAQKYQSVGSRAQVMLSFTTDPYHPGNTLATTTVLRTLMDHGMAFCTLTKGGTKSFQDIEMFRPTRDAFASTLTSLDERFQKKWERAAASPADRLAALKAFHDRGIFTWVSLEPTLSAEASLGIVEATHEFVDLYKVGRANYIKTPEPIDWRDYTLRMIDLLQRFGKRHYIKHDLQPYLPAGYDNPLRVAQHH